jgi:DNA replication protein
VSDFKGFPAGRVRMTSVPDPFFSELLPQIDHLAELKVTLYCICAVDQQEGNIRYVQKADLLADAKFMQGVEGESGLDDALERAVKRGSLLKAEPVSGVDEVYFLNSPRGRAAAKACALGQWSPQSGGRIPAALADERPNIFKLYEENIGPLTPLLVDTLKDAENEYPQEWIEEAFHAAVERNARNWRYIVSILKAWQEKGRDGTHRPDSEKERRRYVEGELSDFIEH